ncbi:3-oxo-tetronate kinase [Ferrimonas lipolytica]|uniref:3-oxo-tetronate kinase n=1 Tax=Ferrimonas lipolytica TaxID=2724191 RepID=A0A6H1UEY3_9GAMM|nr:3-oxo-tetronate kinase [Ferrimonas lipolytica]QIZ77641.1 four-carbon acid sugar kinase family protein [Ferrimonas lipolytica]
MIKIGVIADDFTGATDIASFLVENGLSTVQLSGVPAGDIELNTDAVVISLKSRSCPTDEAIRDSIAALDWLKSRGTEQVYFKYCSTFDSTAAGNIGPVTDALLDALDHDFTIICPSLPVNGRSVYMGNLFVGEQLLSESGMRNHPVTPMTDSNLVRLMDAQARGTTGLVNAAIIDAGVDAVKARLEEVKAAGHRYAVLDTLNEAHLETLGAAVAGLPLVTGGSGLALGLARHLATSTTKQSAAGQPTRGKTVIFSGSCSQMTNAQVADYRQHACSYPLDVKACIEQDDYARQIMAWLLPKLDNPAAPLVFATADAETLAQIQATYGAERASTAVEETFAELALLAKQHQVTNFIVAGGETSSIVTQRLGVEAFHIGPQIAPGVPWVKAVDQNLNLTLKSGNFGQVDFFSRALTFMVEK